MTVGDYGVRSVILRMDKLQSGTSFKEGRDLSGEQFSRRSRVDLGAVRINADDQSVFLLVGYISILVVFLILVFLLAFLAVPESTEDLDKRQQLQGTSLHGCEGFLELNTTEIVCKAGDTSPMNAGMFVQGLGPLNQFVVFQLALSESALSGVDRVDEMVTLLAYEAEQLGEGGGARLRVGRLIMEEALHLKRRTERKGRDYQFALGYVSKLSSEDRFYWEVRMGGDSQFSSSERFYIKSTTVRESFSVFTITLRVVFFLVAVGVLCAYNGRVLRLPRELVSKEQRAVQVLSAVTVAFNDQFYFVTVIFPNPLTSFLSAFFLANFLFWLLFLQAFFLFRIGRGEGDNETAFFEGRLKLVLMGAFYLVGLVYLGLYAVLMTESHPSFSKRDVTSPAVWVFIALVLVGFVAYIVWVLCLLAGVWAVRHQLQWRHKIFLVFFAVFFLGTAVLFFADAYNLYTYSASKVMITFATMNFYSFFLQYLYSPSPDEIDKCQAGARRDIVVPEAHLADWPLEAQQPIELLESEDLNSHLCSEESRREDSLRERKMRRRMKHKAQVREGGEWVGETKERIVSNEEDSYANGEDIE